MIDYILIYLLGALTAVGVIAAGLYFGLHLGTKKFSKVVQSRGQLHQFIQLLDRPPESLTAQEKEDLKCLKQSIIATFPPSLKDRPFERALHPTTKRPPNDPRVPRIRIESFFFPHPQDIPASSSSPLSPKSISPIVISSPTPSSSSSSSSSNTSHSNPSIHTPFSSGSLSLPLSKLPPSSHSPDSAHPESPRTQRPSSSASPDWQVKSGLLQVRILKEWNEMYCMVGRKRLYYCIPSGPTSRPVCVGAVRLDHLDVASKMKTVKKQRWAILELKCLDKKKTFYATQGPSGEPLKYAKSKSRSSHLYIKHADESCILDWKQVIIDQTKLPASVEPPEDSDLLSEMSESTINPNDQTSTELSDGEDEFNAHDEGDAFSASSSEIVQSRRSGVLEIRDIQTWNKRFFKIREGFIAFFRSDKNTSEDELLGVIRIERAMQIVPVQLEDDAPKKKEKGDHHYYSFRIFHPEFRRIFCNTRTDGTKLPSVRDHGNAHEIFLRTQVPLERAEWIQSIGEQISRAATGFTESVPLIPPEVPFEPTHFFNFMMARNWDDMMMSHVLQNNIKTMIEKQIAELQLPKNITEITLDKLEIGTKFFDFLSYRYRTIIHSDIACPEIVADFQVTYNGGLAITLGIQIQLAKGSITLPIVVRVGLQELNGRVTIYAPPSTVGKPAPKWQLFFPEVPTFKWDIHMKAERVNVSKISKVKNFLISALEAQVCSAIVWPSRLTFHIPFPGRKLGIKLEKYTSTARPVRDGPRRQAPLAYETETVITLKFIISRFLEEALNTWDLNIIPTIFAPDCNIFGISPFYNGPHSGFDGVREAIAEIRSPFPDFKITIVDMAVEGSSNVIVRFNIRGTHQNDFWEAPATGKRILLHGLFTARINQALISVLRFYWDSSSIYALL